MTLACLSNAVARSIALRAKFLIVTFVCVAACAPVLRLASPPRPGGYAIIDVSVLPMKTEGLLAHQTVIVRGDRIIRVGPARSVRVDPDLKVIDGKGRYLMPGLADMHIHAWSERELPLFLANGITLVRNMWGERSTLEMRRRVIAGEVVGPTIVTAGPLIDGEPRIWPGSAQALTPEAGAALVAEHKATGFDFIKVYSNLNPDVFDAIAAASKRLDIPFAGHVPRKVPLEHALRSGMRSIEHLTGYNEAMLADGYSFGADTRSPAGLALATKLTSGDLAYDQVFDSAKLAQLAELTRRSGVWNVPTLIVRKNSTLTRAENLALLRRPEQRYVSPSTEMGWARSRRLDADQTAFKVYDIVNAREVVAALRRAGAPMLAGTDTPNPEIIPGFALHDEFALLEQAGLTRYEVLKTATVNPAIYFGTPGAFGVVAEGARADLLLLNADPLDDLANLKRRTGVMLRGRWLPEAQLQEMIEEIATYYRTTPEWFAGAAPLALPAGSTGEQRLQFVTAFDNKPIAGDRLAIVATPGGGRSVIAQTGTNGRDISVRDYRLDLDSASLLADYNSVEAGEFPRKTRLSRDGTTYRLTIAGKSDQAVTVAAREFVLTDTVADGLILARVLRGSAIGESRPLALWRLAPGRSGLALSHERWTVERLKDRDGVAVFDIRAQGDAGPPRRMTLLLDLDRGLPVREEEQDGLRVQRRVD